MPIYVRAYHLILTAYGFWLPNDPRGSWSDFVRSWELQRFGPATRTLERRSVARTPHNVALRLAAKESGCSSSSPIHGTASPRDRAGVCAENSKRRLHRSRVLDPSDPRARGDRAAQIFDREDRDIVEGCRDFAALAGRIAPVRERSVFRWIDPNPLDGADPGLSSSATTRISGARSLTSIAIGSRNGTKRNDGILSLHSSHNSSVRVFTRSGRTEGPPSDPSDQCSRDGSTTDLTRTMLGRARS